MNQIRSARLSNEFRRLRQLERDSSFFRILAAHGGETPESFLLAFKVKSLVKNTEEEVVEYTGRHLVQIYCPVDFPREEPTILFLRPDRIFHPNILAPFICLNQWVPSMWLDEVCHRIAALLGYRSFTMDERESLNREACAWARLHQDRFPIDPRPLLKSREQIRVW